MTDETTRWCRARATPSRTSSLSDGPGSQGPPRAGRTAFGVNAIELPPGYETGRHFHDEQKLYFVYRGRIEMTFNDDSAHVLGPGGLARSTRPPSQGQERGEEPAVYLCAGGKDGYVGRDGRQPEGETTR